MNCERAKELLPVIQAFAANGKIQCRSNITNEWVDCPNPEWNDDREYRIKSTPREFWIAKYGEGMMEVFNKPLNWAESKPWVSEVIHVREILE